MLLSVVQMGTPFGIDASSGRVRLTSRLDFSVAESYALTITAQVMLTTALCVMHVERLPSLFLFFLTHVFPVGWGSISSLCHHHTQHCSSGRHRPITSFLSQ